jgi:hypothetical protein
LPGPGQQIHTHALDPVTLTLAVLVPASAPVPGSPLPVSPVVWCQSPSTKPELAVALSDTIPSPTHTVCVASADGVPPFTEIVHHTSTFFTVRVAGVAPLQPELPPLLLLLLPPLLLVPPPLLLPLVLPPVPVPELLHAAQTTNAALQRESQADLFIGVPFARFPPAAPRATADCSRRPQHT